MIFEISYTGGTGNDVTLTQVDTFTATGDVSDEEFTLVAGATDVIVSRNGTTVATILQSAVNEFVISSTGGDDNLIVDYSGGNPIPARGILFDGGVGGNDSMEIIGGSATTVTHSFTNANDGSVDIDGSLLTYIGLEPILDNLDAVDREFIFTGADEVISVTQDVNPLLTFIDSGLSESVSFTNPSSSLTIISDQWAATRSTSTEWAQASMRRLRLTPTTTLSISMRP